MSDELKECPCCGDRYYLYTASIFTGGWHVMCGNCGAVTSQPADTWEAAQDMWNNGDIMTGKQFTRKYKPLEPCPFCGAEYEHELDDDDNFYSIVHKPDCFFCFNSEHITTRIHKHYDAAIDAWNRRNAWRRGY